MKGFLGTGATFAADLNLVAQAAMGTALVVGAFLARRKRYSAHGVCQATVMLLNLVMIALVMLPSFGRQVAPQIPTGLGDRYYTLAIAHAALGAVAELLGLYIVLGAATNIFPQRLRFRCWKRWMRAELALWWLVVFIGAGTYSIWYLAPVGHAAAVGGAASTGRVTVKLTNFAFTPKEVTVAPGATVEWADDVGRHTVEADDGSFHSASLLPGDHFEHTFSQPGPFAYHCGFHGGAGGKDMAGVVRVVK